MVERAPQTKQDEQYPLLKVDGGGGDGGAHPPHPSPTLVTPGWGVTCSPKQSWLVRWPEYISACWMTLILLGISFLVFYALGMEAYRRQPVLIMKCNITKPAPDVYYHHIVPHGSIVPFMLYSDYLSNVATAYPSLNFHVFFLIDDSLLSAFRGPKLTKFTNKMIPYSKFEIAEFQRRFKNVNVTVILLSKFMANTPLKFKWRSIPTAYLPFYTRVFSVWQTGGVGMDLTYFNNNFNNHQPDNPRMHAILKQHNDGSKVEDYTNALNKFDREEEEDREVFLSTLCSLVHEFLNETSTLLSRSFVLPQIGLFPKPEKVSQNQPLVRSHRNKREVTAQINDKNNQSETISNVYVEIINSTNDTDLKKNEYQTLSNTDLNLDKIQVNLANETKALQIYNDSYINMLNKTEGINKSEIQTENFNKSNGHQVIFFYDIVFSDGLLPLNPEPLLRTDFRPNNKPLDFGKPAKHGNSMTQLLTLHSEGTFIAAFSRLHPFLGHLMISAGCQRMQAHMQKDPKSAIQDTLIARCSEAYKEDTYCNNIYLI